MISTVVRSVVMLMSKSSLALLLLALTYAVAVATCMNNQPSQAPTKYPQFQSSSNEVDNSLVDVHLAQRSQIPSFKVMDILARAIELEDQGRKICHMEVGQPSTKAPLKVIEAAKDALSKDKIGYTSALGLSKLRSNIREHYKTKYGVPSIKERNIVITTGSSASFLMLFLGCFNPGDCVGLCSSGYPCYRNIMTATNLEYVSIPLDQNYKLTASVLRSAVEERRRMGMKPLSGLILSSPSNPTGVMLSPDELKDLCSTCEEFNILFISDEIYHGISYGTQPEATAAAYTDQAVIINSFSKYYSMTGWRLGWMIVPDAMVSAMNRLAQNMYISAPTLSQLAACEAFSSSEELDANVARYAVNRRIVLDTLDSLGLLEGAAPSDGGFYVYIDLLKFGVTDSGLMCERLLEEAGVALTPGIDFEDPASGLGNQRVRFSYSRATDEVEEGMRRFKEWWLHNR